MTHEEIGRLQQAYWFAFVTGAPRSVLHRHLDGIVLALHGPKPVVRRWAARARDELEDGNSRQ